MAENNKELMLKDVIHNFFRLIVFLRKRWIFLLIAGIAGGALGFIYAYNSKPKYEASVDFILSNNSDESSFSGLASQLGFNVNVGNSNFFSGDNIISLMTSRPMVQSALMKIPPGQKTTLLNTICKDDKFYKGWIKKERTKNAFPFPNDTSKMTLIQDSLFRAVYNTIQDKYLSVTKPDKNLSIYNVTVKSHNEIFSFYLSKYIVDVTSSFYIATQTKVSLSNLNMLQHEADSLKRLLGSAITTAASQTDQTYNLNPAYSIKRSGSEQSQAQITVVGTAYGEIVKNLELAKVDLQKQTPLYQVIDEPVLPLEKKKKSKLIYLVVGGFLGVCFVSGFLVFRRIAKNKFSS